MENVGQIEVTEVDVVVEVQDLITELKEGVKHKDIMIAKQAQRINELEHSLNTVKDGLIELILGKDETLTEAVAE